MKRILTKRNKVIKMNSGNCTDLIVQSESMIIKWLIKRITLEGNQVFQMNPVNFSWIVLIKSLVIGGSVEQHSSDFGRKRRD